MVNGYRNKLQLLPKDHISTALKSSIDLYREQESLTQNTQIASFCLQDLGKS